MSAPGDPPSSVTRKGHLAARSAAAAISGHIDTRTAAMEVADQLYDEIDGPCHLLMAFASFHHRAAFSEALECFRHTLSPKTVLAVTAESVLGVDEEREGRAGLSALAMHMPGVALHPWAIGPGDVPGLLEPEPLRERLGVNEKLRGIVVLADPFTTPMNRLLPAIGRCRGDGLHVPVAGGMASGASQPGLNLLGLDDEVRTAGAVGVSIAGDVGVDVIVSQGCRPIGRPVVVTRTKDNVIQELGGQVPMAVLKEFTLEMPEEERALLNRGLLVGVVIDEYRDHFGRGDFLVRNVVQLDLKQGTIAIADRLRVGQTVQFHVRDAATASEDMQLLLDAQQLRSPPFAALLFTCNSRGTRLFDAPHHDISALRSRLHDVPTAGLFAAGEIGPIAKKPFLHGHTASVAVFR